VRGLHFTADNWICVKNTIGDVVLAENGVVSLSTFFILLPPLQQCDDSEEYTAMHMFLRLLVDNMRAGYLRCAARAANDH